VVDLPPNAPSWISKASDDFNEARP
jgi:hypothetical protein